MPRKVRLQDVADAVGLAKSSVSMALRDDPRMKRETRQRVQAAAAQLGYRPDPALRRLSELRWGEHIPVRQVSLALLAWSRSDYPYQREDYVRQLGPLSEALGYGFETIFAEDLGTPKRLAQMLQARGIAGLLVFATHSREAWAGFPWEDFAVVQLLTGSGAWLPAHTVRHDTFGALLSAGQRVLARKPENARIYLLKQDQDSLTDIRDQAAARLVIARWQDAGIRASLELLPAEGLRADGFLDQLIADCPEVAILPSDGYLTEEDTRRRLAQYPIEVLCLTVSPDRPYAGYIRSVEQIAHRSVLLLDSLLRHDMRGLPSLPEQTLVPDLPIPGLGFPEV